MGNSASSSSRAQHDESVDYGFLFPQGVYTGQHDWNQQIATQLIIERRLAPFYRPLEDYDDSWDDEQILAARRELPEPDSATAESNGRSENGGASRSGSISSARKPGSLKEPSRIPEAMIYRDAVECPICFLYYPPNINHSRCCDQAICTECFVQIKRSEPTTTHLVSEPAACPYCVQENFGVVYTPPPWRAGIGADGSHSPIPSSKTSSSEQASAKDKARRKSFGADSAEVVTIDQIRPDWEVKLAAVRAAVARRANRRIIMRQVGDRLIPVGVTSGRIHPFASDIGLGTEQGTENPNENEARGSRRSRRRRDHQQQPQDLNHLLGSMGIGQDIEELMVMEAMRISLLEHEEQQRKEAEKKRKEEAERAKGIEGSEGDNPESQAGPSTLRSELPPIPSTSPIDVVRTSNHALGTSEGSSPASEGPSSFNTAIDTPLISSSPNNAAGSSSSSRSHVPVVPSPLGSSISAMGTPLDAAIHSTEPGGHTRTKSHSSIQAPTPKPGNNSELPALSTLSAALSAHNVASAILANGECATQETASVSREGPDAQLRIVTDPLGAGLVETAPTPPPKIDIPPLQVPPKVSVAPAVPRLSNNSTWSTGSVDNAQPYDQLPSSPESAYSSRPLLVETPTTENVDPEQTPSRAGPSSSLREDSL